MIPLRYLIGLLLVLLLVGCEKKTAESSPVLLQIDGRTVSLEEFRRQFEKTLPPGHSLSVEETEDLQRSFLVQLIDRELALAEAVRLGVVLAPEELEAMVAEYRRDYPEGAFEEMLAERGVSLADWRRELEEGLLIEKVVRQAAYSDIEVSEEEIAEYYQSHHDEFDRPAQARVRQIVVGDEQEGRTLLEALQAGEDFAFLARNHSLSPDGEDGGDLDFISRGEMPPEFDEAAFSLPVGQLSALVKSDYGYHILLVEERRDALRLSLEQAREQVRDLVLETKQDLAYQQWLQDLRSRAAIEVNWSLL
ncbi:peptidylprolyl isomerase [Desulfuromonas versatilis]|uniref:Peptidylprolyl isomerase n=1 Tax=Desulfuromonas versatilis TaxID=2802975 RepID=A0ABM8HNH4_9BACT|nr:peptidyl-prolyl cis-trans isomerase [Desulfuromonas versatilis]BCR02970.1 peptidylprolyl isomerase [Desulfuromonas versatilis]